MRRTTAITAGWGAWRRIKRATSRSASACRETTCSLRSATHRARPAIPRAVARRRGQPRRGHRRAERIVQAVGGLFHHERRSRRRLHVLVYAGVLRQQRRLRFQRHGSVASACPAASGARFDAFARSCSLRGRRPRPHRAGGGAAGLRARAAQFAAHRAGQRRSDEAARAVAQVPDRAAPTPTTEYEACLEQVDAVYIALPNSHARRVHDPRGAAPACTCCARSRWRSPSRSAERMIEACRRQSRQADDRVPAALRGDQPARSSTSCARGRIGEPKFFNSSFSMTVRPATSGRSDGWAAARSTTSASTASTPRATCSAPSRAR